MKASARADGRLRHPVLFAAVAAVCFAASALVAWQEPVPGWELRLTEWINDAPAGVASAMYPIMQLGTLAAPLLAAFGIVIFRRDWLLAGVTVVVGLLAWFGAKEVKQIVERGRPRAYLPEINVREGDGAGLGFISGHSAVAAATAVMVIAALPARYRPIPVILAVIVGIARIVHGVHLPADVVGGWSFGSLIAIGGLWVADHLRREPAGRPGDVDLGARA